MRHAIDHRKLRRSPSHRKALLRNLMNALVRSERIETTVEKAKELRRLADRLITLGKRNTTHARRRAFALLSDKENTEKLFSGLAARFQERAGGYTRILRTGFRVGDGAAMAIIEYLPKEEKKTPAKKPARKKAAAPKKEAAPAAKPKKKPAAKPARKKAEAAKPAAKPKKKKAETAKPAAKPKKKSAREKE